MNSTDSASTVCVASIRPAYRQAGAPAVGSVLWHLACAVTDLQIARRLAVAQGGFALSLLPAVDSTARIRCQREFDRVKRSNALSAVRHVKAAVIGLQARSGFIL